MPRFAPLALPLLILGSPALSDTCRGDDWPQWLGPQRDGVYREGGVDADFSDGAPAELWRVKVGGGYAGPAVAGGRVFLPDWTPDDPAAVPADQFQVVPLPGVERVLCLDAETGKQVWEYAPKVTYEMSYPAGPRVTPTVKLEDGENGRVYFLGGMGDLVCLDAKTGGKVWGVDVVEKFGSKVPMWGFSSHPLIGGDNLYVIAGPTDGPLLCLDKATGELKWKACESEDECGYAPPVLYEVGGVKTLVAWTAESVNGVDPATGEVYWTVPLAPSYNMSIAHPVLAEKDGGQYLYCMSHDPTAVAMLKLDGKNTPEVLWRGDTRTGMNGVMDTPVLRPDLGEDGLAFSPDRDGVFVAASLKTGKPVAKDREFFERPTTWGNVFMTPVAGTGAAFFALEDGTLKTGELNEKGVEITGSAKLLEPTQIAGNRKVVWVHPAYAMQSVFWRNDRELVRADLAE